MIEKSVSTGEAVRAGLDELVEADLGGEFFADLAHVPEVGVRGAKLGFSPSHPNAAVPAMVFGMVAGDELAAGRVDGMQMGTVFEDGIDTLWDLAGFHLVGADELACGGKSELGA